MSGIPKRYTRGQAIMHLLARKGDRSNLALWRDGDGVDHIFSMALYSRSDEWLPRIDEMPPDGILCGKPTPGWPSEAEIQAEIEASQKRADWAATLPPGQAMCVNDMVGVEDTLVGLEARKKESQ